LPEWKSREKLIRQEWDDLDLTSNASYAIPFDPIDIQFLITTIAKKKPTTVLEFGSGFSTIAIAKALQTFCPASHLWSVESNPDWLTHTQDLIKNNQELSEYITLFPTTVSICQIDNQVAHICDSLPNIVPELIYLDGPFGLDVCNNIRGISFSHLATNEPDNSINVKAERGHRRKEVSADILLYESTLRNQCTIIVDGRDCNSMFLKNNLK